jgi:hypothetical protein
MKSWEEARAKHGGEKKGQTQTQTDTDIDTEHTKHLWPAGEGKFTLLPERHRLLNEATGTRA